MSRMRVRTMIVSLVAAASVAAGGVVAAPALADASQPATPTPSLSSPVTGTVEALLLTVDRLLLPGCLEATLSILLRQGGTPGPCLN